VIHLPHASTTIPASVRNDLLLSDEELALELVRMTDHFTDELVSTALPGAPRVCFPVSRLVVDPERFPQDADEPMSQVGMGVIYERTSHGAPLRRAPTPRTRQRLVDAYYVPHHAALEAAVAKAVNQAGYCTLLDMHSFPSHPLPYELDQRPDRADICIGTDEFHTPARLADAFVRQFSAEGLTVAVNRPFKGTLVPMRYFQRNRLVMSIMVEVNRGLYLNEETGKAGGRFGAIQAMLAKVLTSLADLPEEVVEAKGSS
jgi:N-formylglutamate amidohydrolase